MVAIARSSDSDCLPARVPRSSACSRPAWNCCCRRRRTWNGGRTSGSPTASPTTTRIAIRGLRPIGRLREGATLERAQQDVEAVATKIRAEQAISRGSGFYARLEPWHRTLVSDVRPAILALMGAVTFLLLIAGANVANLLLVRASLRTPEIAMRSALGAGRWRVIWQLLIEAIVLTGLGTAGGVALAWFGVRQLLALAPDNIPRADTVAIDLVVVSFTASIALAAAVVFAGVPAVSAFRVARV